MKAVIVEVDGKYASALTDDGQFVKIKNDSYRPGMTLVLEKNDQNKKKLISISAVSLAAAAAIFFAIIGLKDFNSPYGIVSIDVNPSIVINVNKYERVLDIEAVNDDAKSLVESLDDDNLKYKKLDAATDIILNKVETGDYEAEDGTTFVVLAANSVDEKYSEQLAESLESVSSEHEDINAQVIVADDELAERAKEAGTTAGKMYLVDRLREEYGPDKINEEEWLDKPVKDIVGEIRGHTMSTPPEEQQDNPPPKPEDAGMMSPENNEMPENGNDQPADEPNAAETGNDTREKPMPPEIPENETKPEMPQVPDSQGSPEGPGNPGGGGGNPPGMDGSPGGGHP